MRRLPLPSSITIATAVVVELVLIAGLLVHGHGRLGMEVCQNNVQVRSLSSPSPFASAAGVMPVLRSFAIAAGAKRSGPGPSAGPAQPRLAAARAGCGLLAVVAVRGFVQLMSFFGDMNQTRSKAECPDDAFLRVAVGSRDILRERAAQLKASLEPSSAASRTLADWDLSAAPTSLYSSGVTCEPSSCRVAVISKPVAVKAFDRQQHSLSTIDSRPDASADIVRVINLMGAAPPSSSSSGAIWAVQDWRDWVAMEGSDLDWMVMEEGDALQSELAPSLILKRESHRSTHVRKTHHLRVEFCSS